jgi:hypothetical protein
MSVTQLDITSEGGHTSGKSCSISEGACADAQPFSQEFVTGRLLGYWKCQSGNFIGPNHWTNIQTANAVVNPVTDNEMKCTALMEDPFLRPLWKRGFGYEVGSLFQSIHDIQGTNTCFLFSSRTSPRTDKSHMKRSCVTICLTKRKKNGSDSQWVATGWIIPEKLQPTPRISLHS